MAAAAVTSTPSTTCSQSDPFDVAIVGGGLSGLVVASRLPPTTRWVLLEGAPQLGGRPKNAAGLPKVPARLGVDLGAAWCWPGQQPKVRALLQTLGVGAFEQPDDRGGGTYRVRGGTHALVAALEATSTAQGRGDVRLGWSLEACALVDQGGQGVGGLESAPVVRLTSQTGEEVWARAAVLAVPPKLLSVRVRFDPILDPARTRAMAASRTWMAGVTKVALAFPVRFWPRRASNMGLSGGPAFQVYDGGDDADEPGVLTFFALATGVDDDQALALSAARQLAAVWAQSQLRAEAERLVQSCERGGEHATVVVQRWPLEPFVADDPAPTTIHPHPHPVRALGSTAWGGRLVFAASEADQESPGVMEGAIGAGHAAIFQLEKLGVLRK